MSTEELYHYGTPRHSGRYPWGSGDNPYQHEKDFLARVRELHEKGMSEAKIAEMLGMTTTQLRAKKSIATENERMENILRAQRLHNKGYSNGKIGELMGGYNESTVRNWLKQADDIKVSSNKETADMLERSVKSKGMIDIGIGVERELNISKTRLDTAAEMLKQQGYEIYNIRIKQANNPGNYTTVKVLCPPGTAYSDVYKAADEGKIKSITEYSPDGGKTFQDIHYPESLSSKRIMIRYNEEGGVDKDGVIELRKGVEDISLGNSRYAQVRIAVDGTHYLKGMAMYADDKDLPPGVDVIFNTNKHLGTPQDKVFKQLKDNPDLPFGANIKAGGQRWYTDETGEQKLSVINKVNEEGDWDKWSKTLSSQFLSKQPLPLINRQLELTAARQQSEFDEIMSLTNVAVKKKLLESFADDCDASAVHLKAAALPRQKSHVILPLTDISDKQIYAPNYKDGEKVVLVRYPHGGTFEIPELTVNNKNKSGRALLGNAIDAVGINSKVAERLSGADFDGDTVLVIPVNEKVRVKSTPALEGLINFDPKEKYPLPDSAPKMKSATKQNEMGKVSNLISDMTIKGATPEEITRAVKHSMVVIDAEKHHLDYKKSYRDNGIKELKEIYQLSIDENGREKFGASTLISRAKSEIRVNERQIVDKNGKKSYTADPKTGEYLYGETGRTYKDKKGNIVVAQEKITRMEATKDAYTLSSGTVQENAYAKYANSMKALGNRARKEYLSLPTVPSDPVAAKEYKNEVASLNSKLNTALKNAPRERQAQLIANSVVQAQKRDNPDMDKDEIKKIQQRSLASARARVGADKSKVQVQITDKEWKAIQAGAISTHKLTQILNNTDLDKVRQLATPRNDKGLSEAKQNLIKSMSASGYTTAEIAEKLGCSTSTVNKYAS